MIPTGKKFLSHSIKLHEANWIYIVHYNSSSWLSFIYIFAALTYRLDGSILPKKFIIQNKIQILNEIVEEYPMYVYKYNEHR